jgi:hypothetical protein
LATRTRSCTRAQVKVRVELGSGRTREITGSTTNISLRGLFFLPDRWAPVGTDCSLVVRFASPRGPRKIETPGRIVRSDASGLGIEFLEMPLESLEQLRNLVRHNASDVAQVEREFAEHVAPRQKPRT